MAAFHRRNGQARHGAGVRRLRTASRPRYKKAGLPIYAVLSNYSGNRFEYTTVTFVMKFADLDNPSPIRKALGEEAFTKLVAAVNHCVTSTTWYFSLPSDDVAIDKPESAGEYFLRSRIPIAAGKNTEYRAFLKNELLPVFEKGGVKWYRASAPVFGGPAGTVETTRRLTNLAEIDGGPIQTRVLGAAGRRRSPRRPRRSLEDRRRTPS